MTDDPIKKAKFQAALFRIQGNLNTRSATEKWLEMLGTQFTTVHFLLRDRTWTTERHVADPETIVTTIDMSAGRFGAWMCGLFKAPGAPVRSFPNREAAEMYAIHRG